MSEEVKPGKAKQFFKVPENFSTFDDEQIEEWSRVVYTAFIKGSKKKETELSTNQEIDSNNNQTDSNRGKNDI